MQDARASLRCAMRAGAGSARRPSSARGASRRRRRTPQTGSATQPVPPGAPCAHGAAPGQQQPANNPVLLPLSVALGGLSGPSGVARAPRSAVHPPSAAAAGLSGSRLFSSQAGSGTCPAGAAASSGAAPQGRHEAEIGAGAARERRKQAGKDVRKGRSLAEVGAAFFELRRAWALGVQTEGVQLSLWKKTSEWLRGESVLLFPLLMLHHSQNNSNPPLPPPAPSSDHTLPP